MFGVFKPHLRNPLTEDEIHGYQALWITTFVLSTLYRYVRHARAVAFRVFGKDSTFVLHSVLNSFANRYSVCSLVVLFSLVRVCRPVSSCVV